jgi:hypothetical protein
MNGIGGGFFASSEDGPARVMTTLATNGRLLQWFIWPNVRYHEGARCPQLEHIAPVYRGGDRLILPGLDGKR